MPARSGAGCECSSNKARSPAAARHPSDRWATDAAAAGSGAGSDSSASAPIPNDNRSCSGRILYTGSESPSSPPMLAGAARCALALSAGVAGTSRPDPCWAAVSYSNDRSSSASDCAVSVASARVSAGGRDRDDSELLAAASRPVSGSASRASQRPCAAMAFPVLRSPRVGPLLSPKRAHTIRRSQPSMARTRSTVRR